MEGHTLDLASIRAQFPALRETDEQGQPYVYLDGPAGSQVPQAVITTMVDYLTRANANVGGRFVTSRRNDEIIAQARLAMADFLNASSPDEIIFGANMTTLTYSLSRAIARNLKPGDEIVITRMDHDGNVSPWLALAEQGVNIKRVDFDPESFRLDLEHLASLLSDKTKLVAVGYASNALGTINPIGRIAALARKVGAWLWVDAVHYAPHRPIDVQTLDCDFLACSSYKFFGPHVGILWGRLKVLSELPAYHVLSTRPVPPHKFETGTLNHEGLAGLTAAIDYLAALGRNYGPQFAGELANYRGRRRELKQAMQAVARCEGSLFSYMLAELQTIPGLTIYGLTDPAEFEERCPTVSFTKAGFTPQQVATYLGEQGIFVWDGNYAAQSVTERLGLEDSGGMVRVGLIHYNTPAEVDRLLKALRAM